MSEPRQDLAALDPIVSVPEPQVGAPAGRRAGRGLKIAYGVVAGWVALFGLAHATSLVVLGLTALAALVLVHNPRGIRARVPGFRSTSRRAVVGSWAALLFGGFVLTLLTSGGSASQPTPSRGAAQPAVAAATAAPVVSTAAPVQTDTPDSPPTPVPPTPAAQPTVVPTMVNYAIPAITKKDQEIGCGAFCVWYASVEAVTRTNDPSTASEPLSDGEEFVVATVKFNAQDKERTLTPETDFRLDGVQALPINKIRLQAPMAGVIAKGDVRGGPVVFKVSAGQPVTTLAIKGRDKDEKAFDVRDPETRMASLRQQVDRAWAGQHWVSAIKALTDLRVLAPDNGEYKDKLYAAYINSADTFIATGDKNQAAAQLGKAVELDPSRGEALSRQTALGKPQDLTSTASNPTTVATRRSEDGLLPTASIVEPTLPVPTTAVLQPPPTVEPQCVRPANVGTKLVCDATAKATWYVIPSTTPDNVVAFYRATLPSNGWKIDAQSSDFDGKTAGGGGTRIISFCKQPAAWYGVVISNEAGHTRVSPGKLPDTDLCS